ncbi:hypothetical protein QJQ45_020127, partial [Haematococcus lacustris]
SLARSPRAACLLRGSHFRHGSALYSSAAVPAPVAPAAALLVVGDEILAGSITDVNTPWLAKLLHSRGVDLVRVEFVPDQADDIAATALRLRQRVGPSGFVFSSGGIGPTHDDVTYPALATAFGLHNRLYCHYCDEPAETPCAMCLWVMVTCPPSRRPLDQWN